MFTYSYPIPGFLWPTEIRWLILFSVNRKSKMFETCQMIWFFLPQKRPVSTHAQSLFSWSSGKKFYQGNANCSTSKPFKGVTKVQMKYIYHIYNQGSRKMGKLGTCCKQIWDFDSHFWLASCNSFKKKVSTSQNELPEMEIASHIALKGQKRCIQTTVIGMISLKTIPIPIILETCLQLFGKT